MIKKEQIINHSVHCCFVCKEKILSNVPYYVLALSIKDERKNANFMQFNTPDKNSGRWVNKQISFCKSCWHNIAGEEYEFEE